MINQGIGGLRSILRRVRPASATEGKGLNLLILSVIVGLVLIGGLLWFKPTNPSPPTKKSQSQRAKIVAPQKVSKASTEQPRESSKAVKVAKRPTVRKPEPEQSQEKALSTPKKSVKKTELVELSSMLANKTSQVISLQLSEPQIWESLSQTAEIRLGPGFHTPILQLIRRGTQLQVVGRKGDWLKLELRNGSTGWIYYSLAQPERDHVRKPLNTQKGSKGTSEPIAAQPNIINKMSSSQEVRSPRQIEAETYVSLPEVAKIRSGPSIHAPEIQLIRRGTRLQVVGKKGSWLKLQLKNGSTGWIYHSLAQPERELLEKPLNVLRGSQEVFSLMQNGSEVALVYPE
jgi:SH3-like domain-containing protein